MPHKGLQPVHGLGASISRYAPTPTQKPTHDAQYIITMRSGPPDAAIAIRTRANTTLSVTV